MRKLVLFLILACPGLLGHAATYYVSTTGNDANPGTFTLPWRTIQYALDAVTAGDTVFVRGGVYNESLTFNASGNPSAGYIVLMNYQNETPVLDGTGVPMNDAFLMGGISYVVMDGFEIRNWPGQATTIYDYCHHLKFNNLDIHDFGSGVSVQGSGCHDIEFNSVECHHFPGTYDTYAFDVTYVDSLNDPHHDFVFNNCSAHSDMNPTQNVDGFATGHWNETSIMYNFTYNNCVVYDVFDGWDVSARNTVLNNCLGYNCYNGVWKLWSDQIYLNNCIGYFDPACGKETPGSIAELDPGWPTGFYHKKVTIQNCTFWGGQQGIFVYLQGLDTLVLRNSIVVNCLANAMSFGDTLVFNPLYRGDYNILESVDSNRLIAVAGITDYTLSAWQAFSGQDAHSKTVTDLTTVFVDTTTYDFHLRDGSPAVDAGSPLGAPAYDFEGYARPYGPAFDIGAYEKNPLSGNQGITNTKNSLRILPNPAVNRAIVVFPSTDDYILTILDMTGKTMLQKTVFQRSLIHLEVSNYPTGTYFVSLKSLDGSKSGSSKLIVANH